MAIGGDWGSTAGEGRIWTEVRGSARLALPVVTVQLGLMLMGTVDTTMLGHLSARALAACAIGHIVSMSLLVFGAGTLGALDPLVAQAHGAGDRAAIGRHWRRGLLLAVLLALPLSAAMLDVSPLLRALGEPAGVVTDATTYLRVLIFGNLPYLLFYVQRQSLQAMGIVWPALAAVAVGNLVNALGNYALIFGLWGCPALGVSGSAYATSAARWVMLLVLMAAAPRLPAARVRARLGEAWGDIVQLLRIGVPIGFHMTLELSFFMAIALLMGRLGAATLAGHEIAIMLSALSFMVPLGIGGAAATRIGNAIGAADMPAARRTAAVCLGLGAGLMALFAVAFGTFPRQLAALFSNDPQVIAVAASLLPIAAVFQVFDGTQVVSAGILRGAADTAVPAATALLGYWLLALPIGCILAFSSHLGPRGLWWGITLALGVIAVMLVLRIAVRFNAPIARVGA